MIGLKKIGLLCVFVWVTFSSLSAQTPLQKYGKHWKNAGCRNFKLPKGYRIQLTDFGIDTSGIVDAGAVLGLAMKAANSGDTLVFPNGTFLFTQPILLKDSICYLGQGNLTQLKFNFPTQNNAIQFSGSIEKSIHTLSNGLKAGDSILKYTQGNLKVGDWIQILKNDSDLVTSTWAKNTVKELVQISKINSDSFHFYPPLKTNYPINRKPWFVKVNPTKQITLKCFSIERMDSTLGQNSNIALNYAVDCKLYGILSNRTNFAHIAIDNSSNCTIEQCYFVASFGYGGGGKGYGIAIENGSCQNLFTNSIFKHLRHALLFQSGANGNVISYNYSLDPFWTENGLPTDAAGDIVLHGNYPFANLVEGNTIQNLVIDDSHGSNGPENVFLRNRIENYGIFMNSTTPSNQQVFYNNEIPKTGLFKGLYILAGTGHLELGNKVRGAYKPNGTKPILDSSYYLKSVPLFWPTGFVWPYCGSENSLSASINPAQYRYSNSQYTDCIGSVLYSKTQAFRKNNSPINLFDNPIANKLKFYNGTGFLEIRITDISGKTITYPIRPYDENCIETEKMLPGVYVLTVGHTALKFVKSN